MSRVSLPLKEEEQLIASAQKNPKNFAPIFKHYFPLIKRYFERKLPGVDVDDLTSRVFEKAIAGLPNYKWQGVSFSAWIYRIAHHLLIDYFREINKETNKEMEISEDIEISDKNKGPEELAFESETAVEIRNLLKDLPEREREIIYLKFYEGYTNKTIAKIEGLTETNVSTIVHRAINKLREKLTG